MKIDNITYELKKSYPHSGAMEYEGVITVNGNDYDYAFTVYVYIEKTEIVCKRAHLTFDHYRNRRPLSSRSDYYEDHAACYSRLPKKKWYDFWTKMPELDMPDTKEVETCVKDFIKSNMETTRFLREHIKKVNDETLRKKIFKEMEDPQKEING